jgi:hypothetical protein
MYYVALRSDGDRGAFSSLTAPSPERVQLKRAKR